MTEQKVWTLEEAEALYDLPFNDLLYRAHTTHRDHFEPNTVQTSTLLNIKTGLCPEDCAYCPQSAHYNTGLQKEPLMEIDAVVEAAARAKSMGSTRFCMGAAWRGPREKDLDTVCKMVTEVKKLGMETCVTLGLLKDSQAEKLKEAGLDYYNHNVDTSPEYYQEIISTRTFQDRLDTLQKVRESGVKVCSGGILGLGETTQDRISMLILLANLEEPPESLPINKLIPIPGTPLESHQGVDTFEFVRIVALARILMPKTYVRLSAGREQMSEEFQALCFFAGANSIHFGEKLLITKNPTPEKDNTLFEKLGLKKMVIEPLAKHC